MGGESEIMQKILAEISGLKAEINGLREEMHSGITGLREEMKAEINGLRQEMKAEINGLREEMQGGFERVDARFEQVHEALREVRMIQDTHGKVLNELVEGVTSTSRKLAQAGEIFR